MGENHFAELPTSIYGFVLLMCAISYTILQLTIIRAQGPHSRLKAAIGGDRKGKLSLVLYLSAIPLAFVNRGISQTIYGFVALIWLVPDPRIEHQLHDSAMRT